MTNNHQHSNHDFMNEQHLTRWSAHEHQQFGQKLFVRWKAKPMDSFKKLANWVNQNDWPEHRRRKGTINGPTTMPETAKHFFALVKAAMERLNTDEKAGATGLDEEKVLAALQGLVVREPVPYDPLVFMRAQPTQTLVLELLHRLTSTHERTADILERLEARLNEKPQTPRYAPVAQPTPVAPPLPRPHRPTIAIEGLIGDEFRHIENAVGDRAILKNISYGESNTQIPVTVDYFIWNSKSASHMTLDRAKTVLPKDKIIIVTGGMTTVRQKVFDLVSRQ
jgi:hypothetical protein